ncbi:MAG: triose-phosphate isomerase [Chloroflexi bacterium]|nr:triose-phosphate isomerase [Chloroflexota bacterium]
MRTPIIVGNWKMNTNVAEAIDLVISMQEKLDEIDGVEKVLCPPFVSLAPLRELLKATTVKLGAQNMSYKVKGAYTGEISPFMLAPLCQYVILGHSERRRYFCETDKIVNKKVVAALEAGLTPIVCVGEEFEERESGRTEEVVSRQVKGAFCGVDLPTGAVIAYEPVWAIGSGKPATGAQANETISLIRQVISDLYGPDAADGIRIQYGGSVKSANIAEFISQTEIDGALVGECSLRPDEFASIVYQTADIKNR